MIAIYCYWEREKVLKISDALMRGNTIMTKLKFVHL